MFINRIPAYRVQIMSIISCTWFSAYHMKQQLDANALRNGLAKVAKVLVVSCGHDVINVSFYPYKY